MKPILVGAFEPFGGRSRNRAADAADLLDGTTLAEHPVQVTSLPTVFDRLPGAVSALFEQDAQLILLVGESAEARTLLVERFALNLAHARLGDNAGARPVDEELVRGGAAAIKVRFDPRAVAHAAVKAGVPCDVSAHAGTFCCNAAFYHALRHSHAAPERPDVAFVHVPARWPWARDRRAARGLCAILEVLVSRR